ncbi:hypothetical protein PR048_001690 [Dryococelus australis]|uniref:Uncharacterized protein n=1 Tax=Dryococelus australis TaxID=614101 RepID=A0ABQ9IJ45_9NEOP|nr:hypothetical protein PR048_001690 [Dryococelus australis]
MLRIPELSLDLTPNHAGQTSGSWGSRSETVLNGVFGVGARVTNCGVRTLPSVSRSFALSLGAPGPERNFTNANTQVALNQRSVFLRLPLCGRSLFWKVFRGPGANPDKKGALLTRCGGSGVDAPVLLSPTLFPPFLGENFSRRLSNLLVRARPSILRALPYTWCCQVLPESESKEKVHRAPRRIARDPENLARLCRNYSLPTFGEPRSIPGGLSPRCSHVWESCRTLPLVGGFSRGSPASLPLHSGAAPHSPRFTLIDSQDLDVKKCPNLFIHPIPMIEMSMEQCRNERKWKITEKTPLTSIILLLDSQWRKSGSDPRTYDLFDINQAEENRVHIIQQDIRLPVLRVCENELRVNIVVHSPTLALSSQLGQQRGFSMTSRVGEKLLYLKAYCLGHAQPGLNFVTDSPSVRLRGTDDGMSQPAILSEHSTLMRGSLDRKLQTVPAVNR